MATRFRIPAFVLAGALLASGPARADDAPAASAAVDRAEQRWAASCRDRTPDCYKADDVPSAAHCGGRRVRIQVRRRAEQASRAQQEVAAALVRIEALPEPEQLAAADAHARALFLLAEPRFEALIALDFPTGLRFDDDAAKKRSLDVFQKWIRQLERGGADARAAYRRVLELGGAPPAWQIAAMARSGQLFERAADLQAHAAIPADVRRGTYASEATAAYCDALDEQAEPLRSAARDAYTACVDRADAAGVTGRWVELCKQGVGRLP